MATMKYTAGICIFLALTKQTQASISRESTAEMSLAQLHDQAFMQKESNKESNGAWVVQDPMTQQAAAASAASSADGGGDSKQDENLKEDIRKQKELVKKWFTWPFWRCIFYCSMCLVIFAVALFPLCFKLIGKQFLIAAALFLFEMLTFLGTAINFVTAEAAAAKTCLVLSVVMSALALLGVLGGIALKFQNLSPGMVKVTNDLSSVFPPISYLVVVFLIIQGLLEETASDWGKLALLASFLALGLAMGVSGVVKDMMSYVFIRANDYFTEGEFIYFGGKLIQVKEITWLHTFAYLPKTRSDMFIPNSKLAQKGINNQSRDNARQFGSELAVPADASAEQVSKIVAEMWATIRATEDRKFTAPNGTELDGQIDVKKSSVYLSAPDCLTVKLFGKYYFSHPPEGNSDKPPLARQMEWSAGWNYQVESLLLQFQNIVDKNFKA
jgi:small-conductance mechanosensitive channel